MSKSVQMGLFALMLPLTGLWAQEILRVRWQGSAVQAFAAPDSYCIHGFQVSGPDPSGYVELVALGSDGSSGAVFRARWQDVMVQPFSGGGCLVGFSVSGPDPQGYVVLTAHDAAGGSGDILATRWQGFGLQGYTAPTGSVIQALFAGGPDPEGYGVLSADTVDGTTEVEERGAIQVVFGFQGLPGVLRGPTVITFGLPEAGRVELAVFNPLGQRVATLMDGTLERGYHEVTLQAYRLERGMYFLRLTAPGRVTARKVIVAGR